MILHGFCNHPLLKKASLDLKAPATDSTISDLLFHALVLKTVIVLWLQEQFRHISENP